MDSHRSSSHSIDSIPAPDNEVNDIAEINRREFLKKAGKFAVYTPPTLMLLMQPSYAKIAKSGGSQGGVGSTPKMNDHQNPISHDPQPYRQFLQEIRQWLIRFFHNLRS